MTINELDSLIKAFRPKFGDPTSISISNQYGKVLRLRKAAIASAKALSRIETAITKKTAAERELADSEARLIAMLKTLVPISTPLSTEVKDV